MCGALLLASIGFAPAIAGAQTRETADPSPRPRAPPVPAVRADGAETDKQDHRCGRLDSTAAREQSAGGAAASQTAAADRPPKVRNVSGRLELFHCITVKVDNLERLLRDANGDLSKIVLHLDGYAVQGLPVRRVSVGGQASDELQYDIARLRTPGTPRADDAEASWTSLLGRSTLFPEPAPRYVRVSVGLLNAPIDTVIRGYPMVVVHRAWFWVYILGLLGLFVLFWALARRSDLLRDAGPQPAEKDAAGNPKRKPYSLARTQMALWFLVVIASYLFIWMVTSQTPSLTAGVLGLIGISAGTALGSTVIDSNKPVNVDQLKTTRTEKRAQLAQVQNELDALIAASRPWASEEFLTDVLSDDYGVNLHRFQIFAWTLALIVIFVAEVYRVLRMPDFDPTLLALMGVSAGTYLGFKLPEQRTPPADGTPTVTPVTADTTATRPNRAETR